MNGIDKLISDEQAKIALFRKKISACEQRIEVLKSIQSEDEVDAAAGAAISKPVVIGRSRIKVLPSFPVVRGSDNEEQGFPTKKVGDLGLTIMESLENGGKSLDQIMQAVNSKGHEPTRHNVRCTLAAFREKYGFFENPEKGFYVLTSRGKEYLDKYAT